MAVVASAPGKVFITGAYLVLERPNAGIVLSTDARFFAIVKPFHQHLNSDSWAWTWTDMKLTSPQLSREAHYKLSLKDLTLRCVSSSGSNSFVELAVQYCLAAAFVRLDESKKDILHKLLLQGFDITIIGGNDFYSYRRQIEAKGLPLTSQSLSNLPPFMAINFNMDESDRTDHKPEVAKTGLGSSAAMTTSVVAALLHYLGVVNLSYLDENPNKAIKKTDLELVHVIAQAAHCIAQGKVGSGFDVSCAVYGSQRYIRFSPEVLSSLQDACHVESLQLQDVIGNVLNGNWDHELTSFTLPPLMTLILGEPGTGGSSTVSMVGAVKKWQKANPEKFLDIWENLSAANSVIENHIIMLNSFAADSWDTYKDVINICSKVKAREWAESVGEGRGVAIVGALLGAREGMVKVRRYLRSLGEGAGVPIEPETQRELLERTMGMEGVLLAGVPGAGGYDAVYAVSLGDSGNGVRDVWSSLNVLALLVREDPRGVLLETCDPRVTKLSSGVSSLTLGGA